MVDKDNVNLYYYLIVMTYLAPPLPLPLAPPLPLPLAPLLRLLGYNVSGKVLEDDDKYMKRMSGVVRLFAAMVQCPTVIWGRVRGRGGRGGEQGRGEGSGGEGEEGR